MKQAESEGGGAQEVEGFIEVEARSVKIDKRCSDIIEANELLNDIATWNLRKLDRTERFGTSDSSSSSSRDDDEE